MTAYAGRHAVTQPRLTRQPLPAPRPSRWRVALAWLRPARTVAALPRHDGHVVIDSRHRVHLQTIPVQPAPGRPPWPAAEPPTYGQAPVARVLEHEQHARFAALLADPVADITWHRADPGELDVEFTDRPGVDVLQAVAASLRRQVEDSGTSVDCWNGCHAPLCPGCGCDCHRAAA